MSGYISKNSGNHHQFRIYYKGSKASQLWVSSCSAQIQYVASSKKYPFWLIGNTGTHCPIHFTLSDTKDAWLLLVEPDLLAPWQPTSSVFNIPAAELVALATAGCLQDGQPDGH